MAKLVVSRDGKIIDQYFIEKPSITIGCAAENDLVLDDPLLGPVHISLVKIGKDVIIEDLKTPHGSRVNGKPLARQILLHRDVIELGSHHLRFMSADTLSGKELDRTMLIQTLARPENSNAAAPSQARPAAVTKARLAPGRVEVIDDQVIPRGQILALDRVITTFGTPGKQLLVLTRRPHGVFLAHVEGAKYPAVNRRSIGNTPYELKAGDLIEAAGCRLRFLA